jgi:hypothetical protein
MRFHPLFQLLFYSTGHSFHISFFIIIIGKTALFEPYSSLEDSARLHPVFTSLDFATIIFLQSKVVSVSLASNPEPGGPCPTLALAHLKSAKDEQSTFKNTFFSVIILLRYPYLDYIALNGRMIDELERIWKDAAVI